MNGSSIATKQITRTNNQAPWQRVARRRWATLGALLLAAACGDNSESKGLTQDDAGPGADTEFFTCRYENPFSRAQECREYRGTAWDEARATMNCAKPFTGVVGELGTTPCATPDAVGSCTADVGTEDLVVYWFPGGDPKVLEGACKSFLMGVWQAGANAPDLEADTLTPEVLAALSSDARVTVTPDACVDDACRTSLENQHGSVVFAPASGAPQFGFVFMPGGSVDVRSYAQAARRLAEHGVLVALVMAQGDFALGATGSIDTVRGQHPEVSQWFVGGHSLGGTAALEYAKTASGLSGLLLWAGMPDAGDTVSSTLSLPVFHLSGSLDGVVTPQKIAAIHPNLPPSTTYLALPGGNHSQFGNYGFQEGDGKATLAPLQQLMMASDVSELFMRSVLSGSAHPTHAGFAAVAAQLPGSCEQAQRDVLALDGSAAIGEESLPEAMAFAVSKAGIEGSTIQVKSHPVYAGNPDQLNAPYVVAGELWCKFKTSEALAAVGLPAGTQGTCGDLNGKAFGAALSQLSTDERAAWDALAINVTFAADRETGAGPDWLGAEGVALEQTASQWTFSSARLQVPLDAAASPEFLGVQYCKLLTAERALLEILKALD